MLNNIRSYSVRAPPAYFRVTIPSPPNRQVFQNFHVKNCIHFRTCRQFSSSSRTQESNKTNLIGNNMSIVNVEELCKDIKSAWPDQLPNDAWYITTFTSLITSGKHDLCTQVYNHLITSSHTTPAKRSQLSIQLRDMLMKLWVIVGIPSTITTLSILAVAEQAAGVPVPPLAKQRSESRYAGRIGLDAETQLRGWQALQRRYKDNLDQVFGAWGAHQGDFEWLEKAVIYGAFLADYEVLGEVESQCVSTAGIMVQGFDAPSMWHVRGLMRMGISKEDCETVCNIIKRIAEEAGGLDTKNWIKAKDVQL